MSATSSPSSGSPARASSKVTQASAVRIFDEMQRLVDTCGEGEEGIYLNELSSKDTEEIRQLKNPPAVVRRTLEAVFLLLNADRAPARPQPPEWSRVQRMLSDAGFLSRMLNFDAAVLEESPVLTAYVAAEYFGSGGRAASPSKERRGSLWGDSRRRTIGGFARRGSALLDEVEPLTFSRVLRASRAAAALFRWSALVVVRALDPGGGDAAALAPTSPPSAATPPAALQPQTAAAPPQVAAGAPVQQVPTAPPTAAAATGAAPPGTPAAVPNRPQVRPQPPQGGGAAAAAAAAAAVVAAAAAAQQQQQQQAPPQQQTPSPPPEKPPPKRLPANAKPDRHFESLAIFVFGSATIEDVGEETLQTVCATYCMRTRLWVQLVTCPAPIENDALARGRLMVAQNFLLDNGVPPDSIILSKDVRTITSGEPGVSCHFLLDNDRVLRDFYLRVALGEDRADAGSRDTLQISKWLEENFQICMH